MLGIPSRNEIKDKSARDKAVRKMFKGKKGDPALEAVKHMWRHMKISGIDVVGKIEEVDSHYNLTTKGRDGKLYNIYTHVYSPRGIPLPKTGRVSCGSTGQTR